MAATNLLFRTPTLYGKTYLLVLTLMLLIALMPHAAASAITPRAQLQLLDIAAAHPTATLDIIVQKATSGAHVEDLVRATGGVVRQDLAIINGFSASIPARAIAQLARAVGVRWISLDGPVVKSECTQCISTTNLKNAYIKAIRADTVWNTGAYLQGQGIGVAMVDSGVNPQQDLYDADGTNRLVASAVFNSGSNQTSSDSYGHGNHVAGIIGGSGSRSDGAYIGVAPMVNLINVKVSDDQGGATASNVVAGLQWILNNKNAYNIRVVNISLNSTAAESYNTNPIDAAAEILWFNKIVVVVSAGNTGNGALHPPANDPFVITVGATDDRGTASISDDTMPAFSAYGTTGDGFAKPDLVAPGTNIVALMGKTDTVLAQTHPSNVVTYKGARYFRMSGTSMSAPMVAGAAALLIQSNSNLTPDQVKYRLMATANKSWSGYTSAKAGAGYLDIAAATSSTATTNANTGVTASQLLWTGSQPITWGSANWNSVNWNSVNWNSVNWNSDYWGE